MNAVNRWLMRLLPVLLAGTALADSPDYRLQGGGTVTVDPDTNRATVTRDGVSSPLWDGTHRMEDGSILIINRGMTVPDEAILGTRELPMPEAETWEGAPIIGYSPCERLVWRVCGLKDECSEVEGCQLARQLLDMEQQERDEAEQPNRMTYASGQCQMAGRDFGVFPGCPRRAAE